MVQTITPELRAKRQQRRNELARLRRAANPELHRGYCRAWHKKNPDKVREQHRRRRAKHPEKGRESNILKKYGLDRVQWDELFASQGNRCGLCPSADPGSKVGWHTDHDHTTGRVRGILCHHCNVGLGYFKDDPAKLRAAIAYLER